MSRSIHRHQCGMHVRRRSAHPHAPRGRYEIMDGAPVKGESIPIRLFLAGFELAPTMRDVFKKFSVRYFLNLVLVDEEDRRYFKQQEIQIWRKGPTKKTMAGKWLVCARAVNRMDVL